MLMGTKGLLIEINIFLISFHISSRHYDMLPIRMHRTSGLSGDRFRFDGNGDGPARYNIIHFKQTSPGKYKWIKVGEYYEGELILNMTEVQFKFQHPKPPESVCSLPCERGQAKNYVEGESCCWHCFNCSLYQVFK